VTPSLVTQPSEKRVIVALDVEKASDARSIVEELRGEVAAFKIGLQLFTCAGPEFVREIAKEHRVFLDLKFHDIPNTVAKAGIEAARLGVWMFNVHASGGAEMMKRTAADEAELCQREGILRPLAIAVTVLTSSDANTLSETGIEGTSEAQVLRLSQLAASSGLDGVVASPLEIGAIRKGVDHPGFLIVTPGVRPEFETNDDQKRVMTPRQAAHEGSDYLVIGRPILKATDRLEALTRISEEINAA
jgi:orotidine-5'-phosphate decarboxylase